MPGILVRWLIITVTVLLISKLFRGVTVDDTGSALVFAAILGVLNAFVRPVLIILTLPLTIVTLGFFILVINALLFWFVAGLDVGVHVSGFLVSIRCVSGSEPRFVVYQFGHFRWRRRTDRHYDTLGPEHR